MSLKTPLKATAGVDVVGDLKLGHWHGLGAHTRILVLLWGSECPVLHHFLFATEIYVKVVARFSLVVEINVDHPLSPLTIA